MTKNERLLPLKILIQLIDKQTPLPHLFANHPELSSSGRQICFGVCRYYFLLDAVAEKLVDKKPKSKEVWILILMGIYQLYYMKNPDYAVVKESVALLDKIRCGYARGFVNAVLRNAIRRKTEVHEQLANQPCYQYAHPLWLMEKIKSSYPEHWGEILQANNQQPPMTLRVNSRQCNVENYLDELSKSNIKAQAHPYLPEAVILEEAQDVRQLPGFLEGKVSVQDASAQLAAHLLDVKPGMDVLDACAAPGGKTGHILELYPQLKRLLALDIDAKRLKKIEENLSRLGFYAELKQADAADTDSWRQAETFDRILLDAPCSATGVIRRQPDIKLLRTTEEIKAIQTIQAKLLNKLWPLLKQGGKLLYATCSILPEENHLQIERFMKEHPDCRIEQSSKPWAVTKGAGWQILPGHANMDGFYYCLLYKE